MKKYLILFLALIINCLALLAQNKKDVDKTRHFFVGTYSDEGSEGIYRYGLDLNSGKLHYNGLSVMSENPSFLALTVDCKFLLAVHETNDESEMPMGLVESFSVGENGVLYSLSRVSSGGSHPCYVSVNQHGLVLVANSSSGNVALFKLAENGKLTDAIDVKQHVGNGPNRSRQGKPHVYSTCFEPGGNRIFVADLGIDRIKVYTAENSSGKLNLYKFPEIVLPPGSGPRNMAFHPNRQFLYVVNELSSSVSVVRLQPDGGFKMVEIVSALPVNYKKENTSADIHFSNDGKYLYISNCGLNSIAIFEVNGKTGMLKQIGQEPARGEKPQNFALSSDGQFLLVANQASQNIVSFRRDSETGKLNYISQINAQKPACILFE